MEFIVKRKSSSDSELKHYGMKGQTWGVRNYQYEDGSYTPAGKKRYSENRGSSKRSAVPKTRVFTKNISRASQKQLSNEQLAALTAQLSQDKLIEDQVKAELARKLKDKGITVDPSKVSKEYLIDAASNAGIDVSAVSRIEDSLKSDNESVQVTGESLSKGIDYDQLQKNANDSLSRQDKLIGQFKKEQEEVEKKVAEGIAKTRDMTPSNVSPEYLKELEYNSKKDMYPEEPPVTGESLYKRIDYDQLQKNVNDALSRQDEQMGQVKDVIKTRELVPKDLSDKTLENAKAKQERKETSRRSKTSEGSSRKSMMQSDRNVFYISRDGDPEFQHYGILGVKWGIRRYQNSDGTLTSAGKKRYRDDAKFDNREIRDMANKAAIVGNAAQIADKKVARAEKRNKGEKTIESLKKTQKALHEQYDILDEDLREAHNRAKEKYGEKAVGDLQYRKNGYAKGSGWYNSLNNWGIGARYNTMSMDNSSFGRTVRDFMTGNYQERYTNFTNKWNERGSWAEAARSLINANLSESIRSLYDQRTRNAAYAGMYN